MSPFLMTLDSGHPCCPYHLICVH